ncbi:BgTH12-02163 [Blumeria graminis f. sp. triticale]|uniref:BgTH12-02163 n=1 Tax=Blumeria graminis f. sp. triticale TaxID=1689686 RepID=A0A9W4D072_BLUGR|nr:BgTH12-02163 [Blumeria graminis f. sp. triticale]
MSSVTCVLAFLLLSSQFPKETNRLVLVGNAAENNYAMYEPPPSLLFPTPKNKAILMAKYQAEQEGTSITSYCSYILDMASIMSEISVNLTKKRRIFDLEFEASSGSFSNCYTKIVDHRNLHRGPISLKFIQLNYQCTKAHIARLAAEGSVKVTGKYRCFAPYSGAQQITIDADSETELSQDSRHREAFYGEEVNDMVHALVWYQGHLHIFQSLSRLGSYWYQLSSIGHEENNGKVIYDFISKNVESFQNFKSMLEEKKSSFQVKSGRKSHSRLQVIRISIFKHFKMRKFVHHSLKMMMVSGHVFCHDGSLKPLASEIEPNSDSQVSEKKYPTQPVVT